MRIESVSAHAFGPFKGESLQLGRGMTVIHGPNESGKSTWHAALYAGLCGIRRGPGLRAEDKDFRNRFRPWNGNEWEVSLVVHLADGRHVELHQDLEHLIACQARDADSGRNYSEEIINDGTPDASRWLGLDRRSFLNTACIRQADIQLAKAQAGELQEHLQRAAATAGTDATAAAAIALIDSFRKEFVGTGRRNSNKPLSLAKRQMKQANDEHESARLAHREHLQLHSDVERLRNSLATDQTSLRLASAAQAEKLLDALRRKNNRARELMQRHPESPPDPSGLRQHVNIVNSALSIWENRPEEVFVGPPTSEELASQIRDLPTVPEGDIIPHSDVLEAEASLRVAYSNLETHQGRMPPQPMQLATGNLTAQEIKELASEFAILEPEVDSALSQRAQEARSRLKALQQPEPKRNDSRSVHFLLRPLVVFFRFMVTALQYLFGKREQQIDFAAVAKASEDLRQAEAALGDKLFKREEVRKKKEAALATATEEGLPTSIEGLVELAGQAEKADQIRSELARWQEENVKAEEYLEGAACSLKQALEDQGASIGQELLRATKMYVKECGRRNRQAQEAARRSDLEYSLEEKKKQEAAKKDSDERRSVSSSKLMEAALAVGQSAADDETIVNRLRSWLADTDQLIQDQEMALVEWRELEALLEGQSLAELEEFEERRAREAESMAEGLDEIEIANFELGQDPAALLDRLRSRVEESRTALATIQGKLTQFVESMPSIAQLEEEVERSEVELSRVKKLDQTLSITLELLKDAQDRVHRTLAPELRDSLKPWLESVSLGRYNDIRVDVKSLSVTVTGDGKSWREANLLSHGTTEQIYLLLRVVMSRFLTSKEEICPLILDDVTVHCDPERHGAILSLLHDISRHQQVIIFSQEPETLEWAEERLSDSLVTLIRLDPQLVST